jgi:hypothetical protein
MVGLSAPSVKTAAVKKRPLTPFQWLVILLLMAMGGFRTRGTIRVFAAIVVAMLGAVVVPGCREADDAAPPPPPGPVGMQFNVDEALLGEPRAFVDYGISLRPPAGWSEMPQEQIARLTAAVQPPASAEPIEPPRPLAAFLLPKDPSVLIVSSIPWSADEADLAQFQEQLRAQFGEVRHGQFKVNGLDVQQYLLQPQGQVNFKLLVAAESAAAGDSVGRRLQLDYVVPQEAWPAQVRAVESSIGSLRPANSSRLD